MESSLRTRRNADDRLRRLERAAASGGYHEVAAYWIALLRAGQLPEPYYKRRWDPHVHRSWDGWVIPITHVTVIPDRLWQVNRYEERVEAYDYTEKKYSTRYVYGAPTKEKLDQKVRELLLYFLEKYESYPGGLQQADRDMEQILNGRKTGEMYDQRPTIVRLNADDELTRAKRAFSKDPQAISNYLRARHRAGYQNFSREDHRFLCSALRAAWASDSPELAELARDIERTIRCSEPRWLKLKKVFGLTAKKAKEVDKEWKKFVAESPYPTSNIHLMQLLSELLGLDLASLYPDMPWIYYLNVGDPYEETIIYNSHTGRVSFGNWGHYAERM